MFWIYIAGMHVEKLRRSFFGENRIIAGGIEHMTEKGRGSGA